MEQQDSEQLPVALYELSDIAKNKLEQLVSGKDEGYLIETELERRAYTLDSFRYQPPCTFIMHDFQRHKTREDEWISNPFYTHPKGYKMCLSVFANGSGEGKGTHVSVYVCFMSGEFDPNLQWPCRGSVTVELLDHSVDQQHQLCTIPVDQTRVTRKFGDHLGFEQFIAHAHLQGSGNSTPEYDEGDCLHFRVLRFTPPSDQAAAAEHSVIYVTCRCALL